MVRSAGDWAGSSLPRRPRSGLPPFGPASVIGPDPRESVERPQPAEFGRVGPDDVVPVGIPSHVDPADAGPSPDRVPVDGEPSRQARRAVFVRPQAGRAAVRPCGGRYPRPSWPINRRTMSRVNRVVRFGGWNPPALRRSATAAAVRPSAHNARSRAVSRGYSEGWS